MSLPLILSILSIFCIFFILIGVFNQGIRLFFLINSLKEKNEKTELERLLISGQSDVVKIKGLYKILQDKDLTEYEKYKKVLILLDLKEEYQLSGCNYFNGGGEALAFSDCFFVLNGGRTKRYKIFYNGVLKKVVHSLHKTDYFFESASKIYSARLSIEKGKLMYSGFGEVRGENNKVFTDSDFSGGIGVGSPFFDIPLYTQNKLEFINLFESITKQILLGELYPFESIPLTKVLSMPLKNHFENKYKIVNCEKHGQSTLLICEIFSRFDFPLVLNYYGEKLPSLKSKLLIVNNSECDIQAACGIAPIKPSKKQNRQLRLENKNLDAAIANIEKFVKNRLCRAEQLTDNLELLLLSFCADKNAVEKLLLKAIKEQLLDGGIIKFSSAKHAIYDKTECFYIVFPLILSILSKKYSLDEVLQKKIKYAVIRPMINSIDLTYGSFETIYPSDSMYEHALKCLENVIFNGDFLDVKRKSHIGGLFAGKEPHKNLIFTLIYLFSVQSFSDLLIEKDYIKFTTFTKGLKDKIKLLLSGKNAINISVKTKLIISALAEGIFKDKQFSLSYEYRDFYDFFEYFSQPRGKVKELETHLILAAVVGYVLDDNIDAAFNIASELLTLLNICGSSVLKNKLCFDGDFYFSGEDNKYLSIIFYALLKNYLLGVRLEEGQLMLSKVASKLNGERAKITLGGGRLNIEFKKSGNSKLIIDEIGYANVKNYPLKNIKGEKKCIIEF